MNWGIPLIALFMFLGLRTRRPGAKPHLVALPLTVLFLVLIAAHLHTLPR